MAMQSFSYKNGDREDNTVYIIEYDETWCVHVPAHVGPRVCYQYQHDRRDMAEAEARWVAERFDLRVREKLLGI